MSGANRRITNSASGLVCNSSINPLHLVDKHYIYHCTGEFVDDYTVRVDDVFAMPQSGTGVSVEAVDPVFQAKMLDMLKQTGKKFVVVRSLYWWLRVKFFS